MWHQPAGLQVQRVLVEAQLPVHHLLVVEFKLDVAARRNVDLSLEGLHVLRVGPGGQRQVSLKDAAEGLNSWRLLRYLTMPAAFPLALAWAYKFLATVFSLTEPTNTIPFTFLQQKVQSQTFWRSPLFARSCSGDVTRRSHGEVGDERPFGDLDVEADALGFGARVDHRALDGGVGEARRDAALHLVALDGDVLPADGLPRKSATHIFIPHQKPETELEQTSSAVLHNVK